MEHKSCARCRNYRDWGEAGALRGFYLRDATSRNTRDDTLFKNFYKIEEKIIFNINVYGIKDIKR